jgi:hypothetical protein
MVALHQIASPIGQLKLVGVGFESASLICHVDRSIGKSSVARSTASALFVAALEAAEILCCKMSREPIARRYHEQGQCFYLARKGRRVREQRPLKKRYVDEITPGVLRCKEVVGIHVLLTRSLFGGGIPRKLLLRVSLAKSTSAPVRF